MAPIATQERKKMSNHRVGGPSHSVVMAAQFLGVSTSWIRRLADKPDDDPTRLVGFINQPETGWIEHHHGDNLGKYDIYFYLPDLEIYQKKFPVPERSDRFDNAVVYPVDRERIIAEALPELKEKGYVTRTKLAELLRKKYGYSSRIIDKIGSVAKEEKWPLPGKGSYGRIRRKKQDATRKRIFEKALPELKEKGYVTRTRIRDELMQEYGYPARILDKIGIIAREEGWPLPQTRIARVIFRKDGLYPKPE